MYTLQELCLDCTATNASCFQLREFEELPRPLLRALPKYLSAFDLNRLHGVFTANAVTTSNEWRKLVKSRWQHHRRSMFSTFATEQKWWDISDVRRCYFSLHLRDLLQEYDATGFVSKSHDDMRRRPQKISLCQGECLYSCIGDKTDAVDWFLDVAKIANMLTIATSLKKANQLLCDARITVVLQQSIRRLSVVSCSKESFPLVCEIVRKLVREGAVEELSIGSSLLSCDMLKELLLFATSDCGCVTDAVASHCKAGLPHESSEDCTDSYVSEQTETSSDLYDLALLPCSDRPNAVSVCKRHRRSTLCSTGRGVQALTLMNVSCDSLDVALLNTLPRMCHLEKIGLIEMVDLNRSDGTASLPDVVSDISRLIVCGQLSHIILASCLLSADLPLVLSAVLQRSRSGHGPLFQLSLHFSGDCSVQLDSETHNELESRSFNGCRNLDISNNVFTDDGNLLSLWVQRDKALRHLDVSCLSWTEPLPSILDAVPLHGQLQSLSLRHVNVTEHLQSKLILILHSVATLEKLNLSGCCVFPEFVSGGEFVNSVVNHASLTTLRLGECTFGNACCALLKAICCSKSTREFHRLDLRHNGIDGDALLATAREINGRQLRHVHTLVLSFNLFDHLNWQEIKRSFSSVASNVVMHSLQFATDNF